MLVDGKERQSTGGKERDVEVHKLVSLCAGEFFLGE